MGHDLELLYAKQLLKHSKEGLTRFTVDKIYRVSLVGKREEIYSKASFDFIAVATVEGEKCLVGVECMARVTSVTR
jgi:hypothetical protein